MKRLFIMLMLLAPAMTFAGCSTGDDEPQTEIPDTPGNGDDNGGNNGEDNGNGDNGGTVTPGNGKILIAYFSRWGIRIILRTWMPRPVRAYR